MNGKRYFIDHVQAFTFTNKTLKLQRYAKHKYEHQIVGGIEPFKTLLQDIIDTVEALNEEYPRTKPFRVTAHSTAQIEVTTGNGTLLGGNTVLRVSIQEVAGTLTAMSDGRLHMTGENAKGGASEL